MEMEDFPCLSICLIFFAPQAPVISRGWPKIIKPPYDQCDGHAACIQYLHAVCLPAFAKENESAFFFGRFCGDCGLECCMPGTYVADDLPCSWAVRKLRAIFTSRSIHCVTKTEQAIKACLLSLRGPRLPSKGIKTGRKF